jgi:hypothetical protein
MYSTPYVKLLSYTFFFITLVQSTAFHPVMKLSPREIAVETAYQALQHELYIQCSRPNYAFNFIHRRPSHVILWERPQWVIPLPISLVAKEKMLQLATFQATYHGSITPCPQTWFL